MITRSLTKFEAQAEPSCIWNAYVDLLAMESCEDLTSDQRPAHLVFWYESEVQNGGHLQYFENRGAKHLAETIDALGLLKAGCQQRVLREASALWLAHDRQHIQTAGEFCRIALGNEFGAFDSRYHACSPTLEECLAAYLEHHQSLFVTVK